MESYAYFACLCIVYAQGSKHMVQNVDFSYHTEFYFTYLEVYC